MKIKIIVLLIQLVCFLSFGIVSAQDAGIRFSEKPIIGAIRWDAWHGMPDNVHPWVLRTLSYSQFHHRLPFFATILSNDSLKIDGGRQEIMDQEIHYAKYAGLDYWAFVEYGKDHMLSLGLKRYLQSKFRSTINFCLISEQSRFWDREKSKTNENQLQYVVDLMCESGYQTVFGDRPLWYLGFINESAVKSQWGSLRNFRMIIDYIRNSVAKRGMGNPYVVIMDFNPSMASKLCDSLGADAISSYVGQKASGFAPYRQLALEAQEYWDEYAETGKQVIPNWVAGWNPEPRIVTQTPWHTYPDSVIYACAQPGELSTHFKEGARWLSRHEKQARANTAIIYAWNEFDEGGWLCPTRDVRTGLPDISRIEALRSALQADTK